MIKNLISCFESLTGSVCFKNMDFENIYCNQSAATFLNFHDPSVFPDIIDKEMLANLLDSEFLDSNEYARLFEKEFETVTQQGRLTILDVHQYVDGIRASYTSKTLIKDQCGKPLGMLVQAIELPDFNDNLYARYASQRDITTSHPTKQYFKKYGKLPAGFYTLSAMEVKCLRHTLRGQSAKQVGSLLNISNKTVESHLENLKCKLEFSRKSDLIAYFFDHELTAYL